VGELRLLKPLLAHRKGVLASVPGRFVLRFAWHLTSLSWLVLAVILLLLCFQPEHALEGALVIAGISFVAAGVFDAICSRGRHIGWPLLTAIGVAALLAAATAR